MAALSASPQDVFQIVNPPYPRVLPVIPPITLPWLAERPGVNNPLKTKAELSYPPGQIHVRDRALGSINGIRARSREIGIAAVVRRGLASSVMGRLAAS